MRHGRISTDWFAKQVALADRAEGDIDTLSGRIAQVRTWTFAANRPDWLDDPEHWQGITRRVEDRLSDALHERLTHRFVDRRTSVLMRRLRENTMLDTEITKTGDVVVEGHVIGHLLGFQFAADASAAGPEAKALRSTAQKALVGEIEARAARLSEAADDAFVLSADGTLRWIGDPVAKLIPGEEVLSPRLKIIADEHLTGPLRDGVQARLDLWLKAHIEKLLGPLLVLGRAEDITGIGRGIAFQLVETLGVLERHKVAEEMKTLAQDARAVLRGHSVRFGAHHIYIPSLLKPAPRALAAQLWALKHGGLQQKGLDELPHLASSGRTSIPVDPEIQKGLYRAVGFRVAGERAVRVDILERLADLIRPALSWRPGVSGEKPAGAFDGSGFTATVGMTSLAGCAGEDFASILRSLGYRMERRPAPVEAAVEPVVVAEPVAAEPVATEPVVEITEIVTETSETVGSDPVFDQTIEPALEEVAVEAAPAEVTITEVVTETLEPVGTDPIFDQTVEPALEEVAVEASAEPEVVAETAPAVEAAPAEPLMIEVWRPGRPPGQQRPVHQRGKGGNSRPANNRDGQTPRAEGAPAASEPRRDDAPRTPRPEGGRPEGGRPPREDRRGERKPEGDRPRGDRPERSEGNREPRRDAGNRDNRPQGNRPPRPAQERFTPPRQEPRHDKPVDPDSPFAALLALKARMEADKKGG